MSNRTVPATAEGLPASRRRKSLNLTSALEALGCDAVTITIMRIYSEMSQDEKRALGAAVSAVGSGADPTDEIVAAVGAERAGRFVGVWQILTEDEAAKTGAAR